ncbi:hypothetical protein [Nostoc sp.]|uniref:hypothetical protein n=1 Tax=Nostoc sp. TaxID=1180 RepID=UPI002FF61E25
MFHGCGVQRRNWICLNCDRLYLFYRILSDRLQDFCLRTPQQIEGATGLMGAATGLMGAATELMGVATELMGAATELTGVATKLMGAATELTGVATEFMGAATELTGVATELTGVATEFMGAATKLTGAYKYQNLVINYEKLLILIQKFSKKNCEFY